MIRVSSRSQLCLVLADQLRAGLHKVEHHMLGLGSSHAAIISMQDQPFLQLLQHETLLVVRPARATDVSILHLIDIDGGADSFDGSCASSNWLFLESVWTTISPHALKRRRLAASVSALARGLKG